VDRLVAWGKNGQKRRVLMSNPSGALVFMGPGRSGTTSLYHAFRANPFYRLENDKEVGALSFSFTARREELRDGIRRGIFVEVTPSNILAAQQVVSNVSALAPSLLRFVVIKRPVQDRMASLFLHHTKIGNFSGSLDEYVERSLELAATWTGWFDGSQDITFAGIVEHEVRLLEPLPRENTIVVAFSDLFVQINAVLTTLGLSGIEEITRNKGFIPKNQVLHLPLVYLYRLLGLANLKGLEKLKSAYREFNSDTRPVEMSAANRAILDEVDKNWTEALSRFQHVG
jgi:hypothetical protein